MADINRDLERYLRRRGENTPSSGSSWMGKTFSAAESKEKRQLSGGDKRKLETMEKKIKKGEQELEALHEIEEDLEERQEERVSFYQQFLRFFSRRKEPRQMDDDMELPSKAPAQQDASVQDDFRALAAVSMRWLDRLPTRIKDEFKESDDYVEFTKILERRGVAKRK